MVIQKSTPKSKIPPRPGGGTFVDNIKHYDAIASKVNRLSGANCVPVQCDTHTELTNTVAALRARGLKISRRGLVLYVSKTN